MVKVSSARHWKAISHRLTVNFEGMELDENKEDQPMQGLEPVTRSDVGADVERPTTPTHFKPSTATQLRLICWKVKLLSMLLCYPEDTGDVGLVRQLNHSVSAIQSWWPQ